MLWETKKEKSACELVPAMLPWHIFFFLPSQTPHTCVGFPTLMLLQVVCSMSPKNLENQILVLELDSDTLTGVHVTPGVGCRPHMKSCAHTNCPIHMLFFLFFCSSLRIFFSSGSIFAWSHRWLYVHIFVEVYHAFLYTQLWTVTWEHQIWWEHWICSCLVMNLCFQLPFFLFCTFKSVNYWCDSFTLLMKDFLEKQS